MKQHSIVKDRKQVPLPLVTFRALSKYRDSLQADVPPGVNVSLHAAVHHALAIAMSMRSLPIGDTNDIR